MRLRLIVARHELPSVKLMWSASGDLSFATLLEKVHDHVPLRTESWDLDDYAVQVGDFECLHYQLLQDVLKEDDEVTIRPLQINDLRIRRLTGRHQISSDGRHLIDGISFGRPALRKTLNRPEIHIPPRKDARPSITDGDDEEDVDFDEDYEEPMYINTGDSLEVAEPDYADSDRPRKKRRTADDERHVAFEGNLNDGQMVLFGAEADEDEEDDEDFDPDEDDVDMTSSVATEDQDENTHIPSDDSSDSSDDSSDSSDSDSSDSDSDDQPSEYGVDDTRATGAKTVAPGKALMQPRAITLHQTKAKSTPNQQVSAPGEGLKQTQNRNQRRRLSKKLTWLKSQHGVPGNVSKEDLIAYAASVGVHGDLEDTMDKFVSGQIKYGEPCVPTNAEAAENESDDSSSDSDSDSSSSDSESSAEEDEETVAEAKKTTKQLTNGVQAATAPQMNDEMVKRREALLAAIDAGGVDINDDLLGNNSPMDGTIDKSAAATSPASKRARLDIAGSQRMLLGSLGVRVPKNAADRERTQQKLADKAQRKPVVKTTAMTETQQAQPALVDDEAAKDPNFWRQYIELTAVECVDEDVELGTPPFPYYKRWNYTNDKKRKRGSNAYMARKNQKKDYQDYAEYYNETGDGLDYDEEVDEEYDESGDYVDADVYFDGEDPASAQLINETCAADFGNDGAADEFEDDDVPPLPTDLTRLPSATLDGVQVNDVVVFSKLEVSAATNWAPSVSPIRTATVLHKDTDGTLELRLANRDMPQHDYDDDGQRVYSKFEMEGADDDDDPAKIIVSFMDMVDPRVLVKADVAEPNGAVKTEDVAVDGGAELIVTAEVDIDDTLAGLDGVIANEGAQ